jgi:Mg-chelatase subunit ChlD
MKRKDPRCPSCADEGKVNSEKICETCGEQLVYADIDGTLKVAEKERKCPRCSTENSKDVKFCENCGAEIAKYCEYCKVNHFIEDKVCPKTGEPIRETESDVKPVSQVSRILTAASILAILLFGFMILSHKGNKNPGGNNTVVVVNNNSGYQGNAPRIDVVFVVDTTGSMGDEIEVVKEKIREMIRTISEGQPRPYVRYGLVAYRDRGDEYVTRKFQLTDSLNDIISSINWLEAAGGGDTPESVNEALFVAVNEMNWDSSQNTRKMMFLIGDAEPQNYQDDVHYRETCRVAMEKGIKIHTIGCSGITSSGEPQFREISKLTGGQFDYLTYEQTYTKRDGTEMKVLKAGDKSYKVTGGAKDEWKEGYGSMLRKKQAEPVRSEEMKAAAPSSKMKNNLDEMLTRQVQMEAEDMGVKYEKK